MSFYAKVLAKFAASKGQKIKIEAEMSQADDVSEQKMEKTKVALRELGWVMMWRLVHGYSK